MVFFHILLTLAVLLNANNACIEYTPEPNDDGIYRCILEQNYCNGKCKKHCDVGDLQMDWDTENPWCMTCEEGYSLVETGRNRICIETHNTYQQCEGKGVKWLDGACPGTNDCPKICNYAELCWHKDSKCQYMTMVVAYEPLTEFEFYKNEIDAIHGKKGDTKEEKSSLADLQALLLNNTDLKATLLEWIAKVDVLRKELEKVVHEKEILLTKMANQKWLFMNELEERMQAQRRELKEKISLLNKDLLDGITAVLTREYDF